MCYNKSYPLQLVNKRLLFIIWKIIIIYYICLYCYVLEQIMSFATNQ
jgi:hypothetical protein